MTSLRSAKSFRMRRRRITAGHRSSWVLWKVRRFECGLPRAGIRGEYEYAPCDREAATATYSPKGSWRGARPAVPGRHVPRVVFAACTDCEEAHPPFSGDVCAEWHGDAV